MTRVPRKEGEPTVPPLHVVTDDRVLAEPAFVERARRVLRAGGPELALHLRGPGTSVRTLAERVNALEEAARVSGASLLVNDRVDVAMAFPETVTGVHLRGDSLATGDARALLPHALLGRSVHGVDEATGDDAAGADYVVLGTVWATPSHPGRSGGGPELVRAVVDVARPPVMAIGGVTVERVGPVLAAGGDGVAVLRAVWDAPDPAAAVRALLEALAEARGSAVGARESAGDPAAVSHVAGGRT